MVCSVEAGQINYQQRKEDKAFFMLRGRVAQILEFCIFNLNYQNMNNESFIKYLSIYK